METNGGERRDHKRTLAAAGALVLVTALVGGAAHVKGKGIGGGVPPGNGAGMQVHFSAPEQGPVWFSGNLDKTAVLLGQGGAVRMELVIGAEASELDRTERASTDLVVILDRSGSMSGEKMQHARAAIRELVAQLREEDRFALVTYSNGAALEIPLAQADASARTAWNRTVERIVPNGGTNLASGLDLGLDIIDRVRTSGRVPRAILISDGLANQGDSTQHGLVARASRASTGEYMLSTVGVGADFNEYLMTALADAGTGNYYYLESARNLAAVFADELYTAMRTVASGLAVRIEPGSGVRVVDAAGYPLERSEGAVVFRPGSLFSGQERRIWVTLDIPQDEIGEYPLGRFFVSFNDGTERRTLGFEDTPRVACVDSEQDFIGQVDVDNWARSIVVDAYYDLQSEVVRQVKEGRRDNALRMIDAFRSETSALNDHIQAAPVAEQLREVDALEAKVKGAFTGVNQEAARNRLSKTLGLQSLDKRRAGSKRAQEERP